MSQNINISNGLATPMHKTTIFTMSLQYDAKLCQYLQCVCSSMSQNVNLGPVTATRRLQFSWDDHGMMNSLIRDNVLN